MIEEKSLGVKAPGESKVDSDWAPLCVCVGGGGGEGGGGGMTEYATEHQFNFIEMKILKLF